MSEAKKLLTIEVPVHGVDSRNIASYLIVCGSREGGGAPVYKA
jgi:hypothetical protein